MILCRKSAGAAGNNRGAVSVLKMCMKNWDSFDKNGDGFRTGWWAIGFRLWLTLWLRRFASLGLVWVTTSRLMILISYLHSLGNRVQREQIGFFRSHYIFLLAMFIYPARSSILWLFCGDILCSHLAFFGEWKYFCQSDVLTWPIECMVNADKYREEKRRREEEKKRREVEKWREGEPTISRDKYPLQSYFDISKYSKCLNILNYCHVFLGGFF